MNNKLNRVIFDYLLIIAGTTLMALGVNCFYEPNSLVIGGVSGLAIIIADYAGRIDLNIPIWLTNLALNAPLFLLAMKSLGKRFLIRTLVSTVYLSAALYYTQFFTLPVSQDLVLSSVFGGVLSGAGSALVFKAAATTGGSDMLAYIINHKVRHISLSKILFVVDGVIITLGLLVFGPVNTMYAIIAVFITAKVIDSILEGLSFAKAAFIISNYSQRIADALMNELERGVTGLNGQGMYTQTSKDVLMCVVSSKEMPKLKEIVHKYDQNAFLIVADVREVLGEGFKQTEV
ncbi:MAG: YitT family protein [Clostridiales bacterium]|jgi:uncharacterized membrane-anchored protein YitT (DUF2179 family)|nr:YitT family protein [Clostridiales bacterium]